MTAGPGRRPGTLVAVAALGLALVAGCTAAAPDDADGTPSAATASPTPSVAVAPLTGLPLEDAGTGDRPVLGVKFDNHLQARPLTGIASADIVFESRVDLDHTRFLALYHSRVPELVGPLRSTRLPDAALLASYNAVYAAEATAGEIQQVMEALGIVAVLPEDAEAAYRTTGDPPRTYAHPHVVLDHAGAEVPPARPVPWPFDPDPPAGPTESEISTEFVEGYVATWRYDPGTRTYRRSDSGTPSLDTEGSDIRAANVIVMTVPSRFEVCCEDLSAPLEQTGVVGDGSARIHRDGVVLEGRWRKPDPGQPIRFVDADGRDLELRPGVTWIELVPADDAGG